MIQELTKRLEEATAGNRELDGDLWRYLMRNERRGILHGQVPELTSSMDAIVALVDVLLPTERPRFDRIQFHGKAQWRASMTVKHISWGPNAAIAICKSMFYTKNAKDEQDRNS